MEIKTNEYRVWVDGTSIFYAGSMRLSGTEAYAPILEMMVAVLSAAPTKLVMDLTDLEFLNSSGINLLAKFTIELRKHPQISVLVKGSSRIPWQGKSLPNLQKLYKAVELQII